MHRRIEDGVIAYQDELKKFKAWLETVKHQQDGVDGIDPLPESLLEWVPWMPHTETSLWQSEHLSELRKRRLILRGMEMALGLTSQEIWNYYDKAGLRVQ